MSDEKSTPVAPKERIIALDFLRGFALLGILLMNIQSFAMPFAAYFNPMAYGDLTGLNRWVWTFSHITADNKFMTIFSILYGAGIILITQKLEEKGRPSAGLHYKRTFWLLIIGLVHAYLFWYGDILVTYALTAMVVFWFRKLSPRWLIVAGVLTLAIGALLQLFTAVGMPTFPPELLNEFQMAWQPDAATIAQEIAIYQGGWLEQMADRVPASIEMQTTAFLFFGLWRAGGLMLIGMALFKLGVLTAQRSVKFYRNLLIAGFGIGLPLVIFGITRNDAAGWTLEYSRFIGSQFNYWGSLGVSLGYIAIIMLIAKSGRWNRAIQPVAAVGRTALSNYLFQTIAVTFIFYGHGLGLFGQVERTGQLLIVFGIWAVELIISPLWLRRFRFGPAEWIWRSLTYGRFQPMKASRIPAVAVMLIAFISILQPLTTQTTTTQVTRPAQQGLTDPGEMEAFMGAWLTEQMDAHHIPGAVITFVKDGEVFLSKGYGYADLENQTPFDPGQTVLTTASLGKAFTAVAVLQLAEQGLIDLHEDVRPYIRDFDLPNDFPGTLTFANLLTHTDGYEARVIGGGALTEAELRPLAEMLADHIPTQIAAPGEHLTYGNFAANLAGYLVAEISGKPFEQYVADNILTPLGMTDSTFEQRLSPEMRARVAEAYEYENGEQMQMPFFYINYAPEGGLRTTAADMNRFMLALLNGGEYQGTRILDEATVEMMFAQQFTPDPRIAGITYGLFEYFENGQRALLRDGDGVGTRTRLVLLPDHDIGFFISYNSGDSNLRLDVVSAVLDRYFGADGPGATAPMADHQQRARQFAGTYRPLQADTTSFGKSMYLFSQLVEVSATDEGYLSVNVTGLTGNGQSSSFGGFEGITQWVEVEPLYFERVDGSGQLAFVQNEAGEITQMISGQGYHSPFVKLPWYEGASFQIILLEIIALLLLSMVIFTFVLWPLGALIHRLRKRPAESPVSWTAIVARLWAAVVAGMLALFVFRAIGVLYAIDAIGGMPNFVWGVNDEMISALNSIYLPVLLALPLPIFAGLAWGNRWWKVPARVHYTLVTLAVLAGIWWANYWNLLGFWM